MRKEAHFLLQASGMLQMKFALFGYITQSKLVILYRRFVTTYRLHLQVSGKSWISLPLKMGVDGLSWNVGTELSLTLGNTTEECKSEGTVFCQLVHLVCSDFKFCRKRGFKLQPLPTVEVIYICSVIQSIHCQTGPETEEMWRIKNPCSPPRSALNI